MDLSPFRGFECPQHSRNNPIPVPHPMPSGHILDLSHFRGFECPQHSRNNPLPNLPLMVSDDVIDLTLFRGFEPPQHFQNIPVPLSPPVRRRPLIQLDVPEIEILDPMPQRVDWLHEIPPLHRFENRNVDRRDEPPVFQFQETVFQDSFGFLGGVANLEVVMMDGDEPPPASSATGNSVIDVDQFEIQKSNEKFDLLQEMFQDADTEFLKAKCTEYAFNSTGLNAFIENEMIPGDYPRKENPSDENLEEPNNNEIPENTFELQPFDLQSFLKKYPDPVKHFSENLNGADYIDHSCKYLQLRYRYSFASDCRLALRKNGSNLYLAHKRLQLSKDSQRSKARGKNEVKPIQGKPPANEFYETVLFIENEIEVMRFLKDQHCARQTAINEARQAKALLTCGCCYSDELLIEEVEYCPEGHIFCKECIIKSVEVSIGDGKLDFKCLQDCTVSFEIQMLKKIVPSVIVEKIERKLQEKEVAAAAIPGLESCPFCEYCAIPPEEARVFECENCKKHSCRLCKKVQHVPLKCSEVEDLATRNRVHVEERMTEALLRRCYHCGAKFIREDGCNKMTCVCGALMCYICRKPIMSYDHFYEGKSNPFNKCPLWTNNTNLHKNEVNQERERAIEEVKRKNPDLDPAIFKKPKV